MGMKFYACAMGVLACSPQGWGEPPARIPLIASMITACPRRGRHRRPAAHVKLNLPYGLAVDTAGALHIADLGKPGYTDDGAARPIVPGSLPPPASRSIAADRGGALLVANSQNNRVRRVFANGTIGAVPGGYSATVLSIAGVLLSCEE